MKLTQHTDFSLRLLIFLSLQDKGALVTISDVSEHFYILKNHLTKVVNKLSKLGYVQTVRGKNGGICLAKSPKDINLSDIIKAMEMNIEVVNCIQPSCPLTNNCDLKGILDDAQQAFFSSLEKHTLADICTQPEKIKVLLNIS